MPLRPAPVVLASLAPAATESSPTNAWAPLVPQTPLTPLAPRTPLAPHTPLASCRRVASSDSQTSSKGDSSVAPKHEPLVQEEVLMHIATLQKSRSKVAERYHAAERLADLGPKALAARAALEDRLRRDVSGIVRKSAALALGLLGSKDAEACLARATRDDPCQFVRKRAKEALLELGTDAPCRL